MPQQSKRRKNHIFLWFAFFIFDWSQTSVWFELHIIMLGRGQPKEGLKWFAMFPLGLGKQNVIMLCLLESKIVSWKWQQLRRIVAILCHYMMLRLTSNPNPNELSLFTDKIIITCACAINQNSGLRGPQNTTLKFLPKKGEELFNSAFLFDRETGLFVWQQKHPFQHFRYVRRLRKKYLGCVIVLETDA